MNEYVMTSPWRAAGPMHKGANGEGLLSMSIWNVLCWFLVDNMQSRPSINNILAVWLKHSIWPRSSHLHYSTEGLSSVCCISPIVVTRSAQLLIADQSQVEEGQSECRIGKARHRWLSILTSTSQSILQPFIWPRGEIKEGVRRVRWWCLYWRPFFAQQFPRKDSKNQSCDITHDPMAFKKYQQWSHALPHSCVKSVTHAWVSPQCGSLHRPLNYVQNNTDQKVYLLSQVYHEHVITQCWCGS